MRPIGLGLVVAAFGYWVAGEIGALVAFAIAWYSIAEGEAYLEKKRRSGGGDNG